MRMSPIACLFATGAGPLEQNDIPFCLSDHGDIRTVSKFLPGDLIGSINPATLTI